MLLENIINKRGFKDKTFPTVKSMSVVVYVQANLQMRPLPTVLLQKVLVNLKPIIVTITPTK